MSGRNKGEAPACGCRIGRGRLERCGGRFTCGLSRCMGLLPRFAGVACRCRVRRRWGALLVHGVLRRGNERASRPGELHAVPGRSWREWRWAVAGFPSQGVGSAARVGTQQGPGLAASRRSAGGPSVAVSGLPPGVAPGEATDTARRPDGRGAACVAIGRRAGGTFMEQGWGSRMAEARRTGSV